MSLSKYVRAAALLMITTTLGVPLSHAASQNLVANGGFEAVAADNPAHPADWKEDGKSPAYAVDASVRVVRAFVYLREQLLANRELSGPFPLEKILEREQTGQLPAEALVRAEQSADWQKLDLFT